MTHASNRINKLAKINSSTSYLEIGVSKGETFLNVAVPQKTAVDPKFQFSIQDHTTDTTLFFSMSSDDFFKNFPSIMLNPPYSKKEGDPFAFDIIYIDGLHTFEQSYKDFISSLPYSHEDTIWIFDDTVPSDPWSALPSQQKSYPYRGLAAVSGKPWHGDVFKTIFALHDFHQDFSYATQINVGNPQTIVWKTEKRAERKQLIGSIEKIQILSYFDLLDNAFALLPVDDAVAFELIGLRLTPKDYSGVDDYKKIIKPISTVKEVALRNDAKARDSN